MEIPQCDFINIRRIKMNIAVYPGSLIPITNGHLDIIKKKLEVFDKSE